MGYNFHLTKEIVFVFFPGKYVDLPKISKNIYVYFFVFIDVLMKITWACLGIPFSTKVLLELQQWNTSYNSWPGFFMFLLVYLVIHIFAVCSMSFRLGGLLFIILIFSSHLRFSVGFKSSLWLGVGHSKM